MLKLRQILVSFSEKNHPDMPLLSVVREKGVIVRNVGDKEENHNYVPDDLSNYKLVKQGQFVINKMKAWQGSYGISNFDGIVSPAYFVFDVKYDLNKDFFNRAIRSKAYVSFFAQASEGIRVDQWDLSLIRMKEIPFILPPRNEQDQIVLFLECKISEINTLISIYWSKIELLEEMMQGFIDRATIKGLHDNMNVNYGDNRWDIIYPQYWKLKRLREIFNFRKGLSITKANLKEQGVPVISYGQIHSKDNSGVTLNDKLFRYVSDDYISSDPSAIVQYGDFIFADTSEDLSGCGNCAYIDRDETIFAGYHSIIAHPNVITNSKYLAYLFKSNVWRDQIRKKANGVKVYSITQMMLKDNFVLIPPIDEQAEIVSHLDKVSSKINDSIKQMEDKITILREYKSRLIFDVVTGKIDVRNVKIPGYEYVNENIEDDITEEFDEINEDGGMTDD